MQLLSAPAPSHIFSPCLCYLPRRADRVAQRATPSLVHQSGAVRYGRGILSDPRLHLWCVSPLAILRGLTGNGMTGIRRYSHVAREDECEARVWVPCKLQDHAECFQGEENRKGVSWCPYQTTRSAPSLIGLVFSKPIPVEKLTKCKMQCVHLITLLF